MKNLGIFLVGVIAVGSLEGCANSQQLAQQHWQWMNTVGKTPEQLAQPQFTDHYATGVSIDRISVNGHSFAVIAPAK